MNICRGNFYDPWQAKGHQMFFPTASSQVTPPQGSQLFSTLWKKVAFKRLSTMEIREKFIQGKLPPTSIVSGFVSRKVRECWMSEHSLNQLTIDS